MSDMNKSESPLEEAQNFIQRILKLCGRLANRTRAYAIVQIFHTCHGAQNSDTRQVLEHIRACNSDVEPSISSVDD